jgi:5-methylcytosine-specific restriction endonuclease McrA
MFEFVINIYMKKTHNISILRKISKESLQDVLDSSTSLSNAINKIGIDGLKTYYIEILRERIQTENLSLDNMNQNYFKSQRDNAGKLPHDQIFCRASTVARSIVRRRIIYENLIEYKCSECPIVDNYNGKKISLQLDHINGIRNDHRLENLRWLCPNCHSQQETSFGKSDRKIIKISLCKCGNKKNPKSNYCRKCASGFNGSTHRKFEVGCEELVDLVLKNSMTAIGKMYGVSDNAVRKRCTVLGIDLTALKKQKENR